MALQLTNTRRALPPRIVLYGPAGIGKSTFVASIPNGAVMSLEGGMDTIDGVQTPTPTTWAEALAIIDSLVADPQGLRALGIDSLSALQEMCFAHVCRANNVASIEAMGYGKGYVVAAEAWIDLLTKLTALRQKMAVILVGHAAVVRHEDPRLPGYDRMVPRLQSNGKGGGIMPLTVEWSDVVACAAYQVLTDTEKAGLKDRTRGLGDGERVLYVQERPAFLAKNRYSLPAEMPFAWAPLAEGIRAALKTTAVATATIKQEA